MVVRVTVVMPGPVAMMRSLAVRSMRGIAMALSAARVAGTLFLGMLLGSAYLTIDSDQKAAAEANSAEKQAGPDCDPSNGLHGQRQDVTLLR